MQKVKTEKQILAEIELVPLEVLNQMTIVKMSTAIEAMKQAVEQRNKEIEEWIEQILKHENDLGWMSLIVKLEKFIKDKP